MKVTQMKILNYLCIYISKISTFYFKIIVTTHKIKNFHNIKIFIYLQIKVIAFIFCSNNLKNLDELCLSEHPPFG